MKSGVGICHACLAEALYLGEQEEQKIQSALLPSLAGYRVSRLIGRGGMGSVYEATSESDGRHVALKRIAPEMAAEGRFREQFLRESEALQLLDHPGVVRRFDMGEKNGLPWLAMEFIDGPDLRQVLRRGPLTSARALEIAGEVGEALAAAHAAGIVHRDIKPANVLLNEMGRVKVADFGMVRLRASGNTATDPLTLIAAGGHYSAPELEERGGGDPRADIYSLGALLYHMLAGNAPRAHYRPARKERPHAGISVGVDRIVTRSLQTDPNRRFGSMREMLTALNRERRKLEDANRKRRKRRSILCSIAGAGLAGVLLFITALWIPGRKVELSLLPIPPRIAPVPETWEPRTMTNTLGMKFVEVPGGGVLFSIWETRVSDYAAFAEPWPHSETDWVKESGFAFPLKQPVFSLRHGEFKAAGKNWRSPGFPSGADHAVSGVSASDAMAFCTWLTWKERREAKIRSDQAYRLPTDEEWSTAAGLAPEPGSNPEERAASWPVDRVVHGWGESWPPPDSIYNVVGDEVDDWEEWHPGWRHRGRVDPWRGTAPVNAVPSDDRGLYHLTGNVWEWTETPYNQRNERHALVLRGGSWQDASRDGLSLSFRDRDVGSLRMTKRGFRAVFQESGGPGWRYGEKP